jgi:hypothetical protein
MAEKKVYWLGLVGEYCHMCDREFGKVMYDCQTRAGPWSNMCHACWKWNGKPLGLGRGQKYEKQKDGRWLKVAG